LRNGAERIVESTRTSLDIAIQYFCPERTAPAA
jgi:hypothetical protein